MRVPVRSTAGLFLSGAAALLRAALDACLLTVFKTHLQHAMAVPRYRPVYRHSGRRNKARY
jgi:hypothetical protein